MQEEQKPALHQPGPTYAQGGAAHRAQPGGHAACCSALMALGAPSPSDVPPAAAAFTGAPARHPQAKRQLPRGRGRMALRRATVDSFLPPLQPSPAPAHQLSPGAGLT